MPRTLALSLIALALGCGSRSSLTDNPAVGPSQPPLEHALHLVVSGRGEVRLAQTSCGSDCRLSFAAGSVLHLDPVAAAGASFKGWVGACQGAAACDLRLDSDSDVRAAFEDLPPPPPTGMFLLTVSSDGGGKGRLTSEPDGVDCGARCSFAFAPGTRVVMTPTPAWGSRFTLWSGNACNGTGSCVFTIDGDRHLNATFGPVPASRPQYAVTQVSAVVGEDSAPAAMNAAGQVVGNSPAGPWVFDTASNSAHRVVPQTPGTFVATGISSTGDVCGYEVVGNSRRAFVFPAAGGANQIPISDSPSNYANAVNGAHEVAGDWVNSRGDYHAFFFSPGASVIRDLGTLGGGESLSFAINERGMVTGQAQLAAGPRHAFLWDGGMHDLGSLGGNFSRGQAINRAGVVAGMSTLTPSDDDLIHAVVWNGSSMRDLGTLPGLPWVSATGINDQGLVVGNVYNKLYLDPERAAEEGNAGYDTRAYVFRDGVMWDLNELIPDLHLLLRTSMAINDAGQILCTDGQVGQEKAHAFVLTPR